MSTRANVIIKDGKEQLFFYRHSDGYPEGTMPSLNVFVSWLKAGKIRNNVSQCAGWLVIIGALEYATIPTAPANTAEFGSDVDVEKIGAPEDWKASAYEPTTGLHGDIEFLYVIDLPSKSVKCYNAWDNKGGGTKEVNLSKIKG